MDSEVDYLFIEVIWEYTWPLLISDLRSYNGGSPMLNTLPPVGLLGFVSEMDLLGIWK